MGEIGQFDDAEDLDLTSDVGEITYKDINEEIRSVKIAGEKVIIDDFLSDREFEEVSDGDDFIDDYVEIGDATRGTNPNQQVSSSKLSHFQPADKKFSGKINVGQYEVEGGKGEGQGGQRDSGAGDGPQN